MSVDVEVPRFRGAVSQIGSGTLTAATGSLQLALFLVTSGLGLMGRAAALPIRRGVARRQGRAPAPAETPTPATETRLVEIVPTLGRAGRLRGAALRLGLAAVVVAGLAAGAAAFAKMRAKNQLPEPAAAPPAVRPSTNGAGNLVTYVDSDKS
jgi:hypothetical protein